MAMDTTRSVVMPRGRSLEDFVAASSSAAGVSIGDLEPFTTLLVRTCNSHYRIVISQNSTVLVQGGTFFPYVTDARLEGSSAGGSFLKLGWIGVGLRMEICARGQRIVTSPVRAIHAEASPRGFVRPH
jgi:hypothetical protein